MNLTNCNTSRSSFLSPFISAPAYNRYLESTLANRGLTAEVNEDTENYYAAFEVPGVKKESVKLELNNRVLTVSVEKKDKRGDTESSYTLTRGITVPDSVNAENIGAKLEDGILTVTLPKAEERKPRTISVA